MAVLLKNGAIFVHIPKTAGTWITNVLEEMDLIAERRFGHKHLTLDYLIRLGRARQWQRMLPWRRRPIPVNIDNAFIFTFVRHPLTWYESWYSYMTRPDRSWRDWGVRENGAGKDWHPCAPLNGLGSADFNDFVRGVAARRPGWVSELYSWYLGSGLTRVGRQENLCDDLVCILRDLGEQPDPQFIRERAARRINDSSQYKAKITWDPTVRSEMARLEAPVLMRFGYEPGGDASSDRARSRVKA